MENSPDNIWLNGNKEIGNKDTELEDRSWYILTILIRIGCPSLPKEISEKCTLFSISPVEVEALCCIPQSPIRMIEGHMVSFSEISTSLIYDASRRFADPLDLVVPDTPVSSSSPSRTCSKGARLYSALQSHSLKGNSHAIEDNNPINSHFSGIDFNRDSTSVAHRKSSCHDTTACLSKLNTNAIGVAGTCTDVNMLHTVSSTSKDHSLIGIDHAKAVDLSFKYSRKRLRKDLLLTNIGSRSPPKPLKVARSIFPEIFKSIEPFPPTEQFFSDPPVEPDVADGVNQDKMDMDNGNGCHFQLTLDDSSASQSAIRLPKRAIAFDIQDDSKPKCLLDGSHVEFITNNSIPSQRMNCAIVEDIGNEDNGIGVTMNTFLECKLPNRDDCRVHNGSDHYGLETHPPHSHDMLASDCQNKLNLENAIYHKDDPSKLAENNIADDGRQSDGIKLDLNLNSISEREGQNNSLLPSEAVKLHKICEAKEGGPAGCDRRNNVDLNHRVSEITIIAVQDPDHLSMQTSEANVRNHHVMGGDVNLVNEKDLQAESRLAQTNSEEKHTPRCNNENITKYIDENNSMDKEALTLNNNSPPKLLDTSYVKSTTATEVVLSQEYKKGSSKQKTKGHAKGSAFHNGAAAGDTISSKKQTEFLSRPVPIFKFFTVEEEEGSGGYGTVYKARRKQDGQIFAIKCPLEKTPKTSATNEFLMLKRFGGSNFIIKLEDVVQNNGQDCLILEYVAHDKPEVLRREIVISELQWYGFCMFKALAALHKQGVIHRDVKPGNFLFSRNIKRGFLIDFNLALDQYDSISNNSVTRVSAKTSHRSHMGEIGASCQRSANNGKSVNLRKPNMIGSQTEVGMAPCSKVSAYSTKEEMKISIKQLATWCENKENPAIPLKHLMPLGLSDIRSHRKFGHEILNTGIRSKLGASLYPRNVESGWRQSGAEAAREPLPTQGRKELLNLVQEARQNSQQQTSSLPVSTRKRVATPHGRLATDAEKNFHVSLMPLNSNLQVFAQDLSTFPNNTGIQKCKRDGPCVGTKGYRAPEVLLRSLHQGPKLDIWSAGVTLLNFIVGKSPFPASSTDQALKDIAKMRGVEEVWELSKLHDRQQTLPQDLHSVQFEYMTIKKWCEKNTKRLEFLECIPMSLYDLVEKCLCVNPRQRIDADEALKHEFFAPCREEYKKQRASKELSML